MRYSVLMSVYAGEKAEYFKAAADSILAQSLLTDDFVIVCDGHLTPALEEVLTHCQDQYPSIINVVRLEKQPQWADVLNAGLNMCKHTWVARMDSDDISVPLRCEKQLSYLREHPDVQVLSTGVGEFTSDPAVIHSMRILPLQHEAIAHFAKTRCPLNHATVIYNKEAVLAVGGYEHFPANEDYQLWIKMIQAGYRLENMDDIFYLMRAGENLYQRRGGKDYLKNRLAFRRWLKASRYIGWINYVVYNMINAAVILMPSSMRGMIYKVFLRKRR